MKQLPILFLLFFLFSCQTEKKETKFFKVAYKGALKNMMQKGDISGKVELSKFKEVNNFYALGAFENLKGEIQIFNSKPHNSLVSGNSLKIDKTFSKKATLLVYASVKKWKNIKIPAEVITYEQFEKFIKKAASENEINTEEPFPFLLEGKIQKFDWHVINWRDGDTIHTHKKHKTKGMYGTIKNKKVEMLGFYSEKHKAIFTHHTRNSHIHVKMAKNGVAGHVDDLLLDIGMTLKLPNVN
ncbi:MAG: acetolactate decarboxylase [Flavobacteriaceae bacterium]|nr:acetolactate decarboxylase [Flavobacteriaceae bacterium]